MYGRVVLPCHVATPEVGDCIPVAMVYPPLALNTPRVWQFPSRRRWPSARQRGRHAGTCCQRRGGRPACCSRRTRRGSRRACRCCSPPTARCQPSSICPWNLQGRGERGKEWIKRVMEVWRVEEVGDGCENQGGNKSFGSNLLHLNYIMQKQ